MASLGRIIRKDAVPIAAFSLAGLIILGRYMQTRRCVFCQDPLGSVAAGLIGFGVGYEVLENKDKIKRMLR